MDTKKYLGDVDLSDAKESIYGDVYKWKNKNL
jgi:hypothetical protein